MQHPGPVRRALARTGASTIIVAGDPPEGMRRCAGQWSGEGRAGLCGRPFAIESHSATDPRDRRRGARDRFAAPDLIPAALGCSPTPNAACAPRDARPPNRDMYIRIYVTIRSPDRGARTRARADRPLVKLRALPGPNPVPWPRPPRAFLHRLPARHCQTGQTCRPVRKRALRGVRRPPRLPRNLAPRASHLRRCLQTISREAACRARRLIRTLSRSAQEAPGPTLASPVPVASALTRERASAVARRAAGIEFRSRVREAVRSRVRVQIRERRHRVRGHRRTQLAVDLNRCRIAVAKRTAESANRRVDENRMSTDNEASRRTTRSPKPRGERGSGDRERSRQQLGFDTQRPVTGNRGTERDMSGEQ